MALKKNIAALIASAVVLGGCANTELFKPTPASPIKPTQATNMLQSLPPPNNSISAAVYEFPDLTGQNKSNENYADFSRAVTQGGDTILIDVLEEVGNGSWFSLVERRGITNVLRERQLITATRQQVSGEGAEPLPPLRFAGILFEGGIITYDSNISTGGIGANYLGLGVNTKFRVDEVTVSLRAVSIQSGSILASVTTTKTIYSTVVQGSIFAYVGVDEILEFEAGVSQNEPAQFAVREAIELAVYALIMEGAQKNVWSFRNKQQQTQLLADYKRRTTSPPVKAATSSAS